MNRTTKTVMKGIVMLLCLAVLCTVVWIRSSRIGDARKGLGRSFDFDLEQYLDVDPDLVRYAEKEPLRPGLTEVSALAVGGGRVYVAGPDTILVLDYNGAEIAKVQVEGTPLSLAVDSEGGLFAGIGNHVEVFDAEGSRTAVWDTPAADAIPVSIALRGDDVFVGEARKGQVLRYDRQGRLVDSMPGFVLFSSPILGIAVDAEQRLWAANPGGRELRRYGADGLIEASWNKPGRDIESFSGCCNPVDIAVLPNGNIVTAETDIVRVKGVSPEGKLVCVVAGPREFDQTISDLDIEVDSKGRVLVLDPVRKTVRVFEEKQQP